MQTACFLLPSQNMSLVKLVISRSLVKKSIAVPPVTLPPPLTALPTIINSLRIVDIPSSLVVCHLSSDPPPELPGKSPPELPAVPNYDEVPEITKSPPDIEIETPVPPEITVDPPRVTPGPEFPTPPIPSPPDNPSGPEIPLPPNPPPPDLFPPRPPDGNPPPTTPPDVFPPTPPEINPPPTTPPDIQPTMGPFGSFEIQAVSGFCPLA